MRSLSAALSLFCLAGAAAFSATPLRLARSAPQVRARRAAARPERRSRRAAAAAGRRSPGRAARPCALHPRALQRHGPRAHARAPPRPQALPRAAAPVAMAGAVDEFVPDLQRRTIMNLVLVAGAGVPVVWMLGGFVYFFVPPGFGAAGGGGGLTAKDALGDDVVTAAWAKAHPREAKTWLQSHPKKSLVQHLDTLDAEDAEAEEEAGEAAAALEALEEEVGKPA